MVAGTVYRSRSNERQAKGDRLASGAELGPRIFLNYRREDSSGHAGRLYEALGRHFGEGRVFIDVDSLAPGVEFTDVISGTMANCEVVLVVIGRSWLSMTDPDGHRRLDDPDDFVRLEIEDALAASRRVIPVLVGGAEMPRKNQLPPSLAGLAQRNAFELTDRRWSRDIEELVASLEPSRVSPSSLDPPADARAEVPGESAAPRADRSDTVSSVGSSPRRRRRRAVSAFVGVALAGVGVALVLLFTLNGSPGSELRPGATLHPGQALRSPNTKYSLEMQGDGNLVLYSNAGKALWASGTAGHENAYALMQANDGNFVIYPHGQTEPKTGEYSTPGLWDSRTYPNPGAFLELRNDGHLVIVDGSAVIKTLA